MNRFKNHVIAAAVFSVLAIIGSIMNSHQAAAQGPPSGMSVNIVNPLPVPVTGSVTSTVTGTVGLASGASVHVNNTVTDPVRVRNVNDAVQPFQGGGACTVLAGLGACEQNLLLVPSGKRAVIEYFSGGTNPLSVGGADPLLITELGGFATLHHVPNPQFQSSTPSWGQLVRAYADSGFTTVKGHISIERQPVDVVVVFSVSGYFVDVPFTP
jgi:hypothetical protein